LLTLFGKYDNAVDDVYLDGDDLHILLYVYNKLKVEQVADLTLYSVTHDVKVGSPVLANIKLTRLVIDGFLFKNVDVKDIRFSYVNITSRGVQILKEKKSYSCHYPLTNIV
jgi:hypothetical protein